MPAVIELKKVYYSESDGKPMGETDWHRRAIIRLIELLEGYYRNEIVYVSGDLLVYYEQGNPKKFVVPDVFVAKGIKPRDRRIFKIWHEEKVPDAIIEVTSRKTRKKDELVKPTLYARLGVPEYFLFDPDQDYLDPALQGHRLIDGLYQPIPLDSRGGLVSQELGLRLCLEHGGLELYRLDNGQRLLTALEQAEQAKIENAALHAELERLRAEISRKVTAN